MRRQAQDRQRLVRYFFFGVLLVLLYQSARMLLAFYVPLLGAVLLAMLLYPAHRRLLAAMPGRENLAALATALGALGLVVVPLFGLGWVFFRDATLLAPVARRWLDNLLSEPGRGVAGLLPADGRLAGWLRAWRIDPQEILLRHLEALGAGVTGVFASLLRHAILVSIDVVAMLCLLFVALRDGPALLRGLIELVPLAPEHKETLRARIAETVRAVIHGALGLAVIQGVLAGIGLALLRVPFPVLLGTLTTLASPIPIIGTNLILGPVVLGLYASGSTSTALKLLAWSLAVVGGVDHVLRPVWISAAAKLPLWLLFFGVLGGLRLYGFPGLLIGPVLVTVALAFAGIYRREYAALGQPAAESKRES